MGVLESVHVAALGEIPYAKVIHVLPIEGAVKLENGNVDGLVKQYFQDAYRPIRQGDLFNIRNGDTFVDFKIVKVEA